MRIALATEGKSEHWIIKHLVENYFKDIEIFFRQVQPQIFDDTQESIGGWLEVLKFCERTKEIDTDESQNERFGVSHTKQGNVAKTQEELYYDLIEKIKELIKSEVFIQHSHKIIFAVCIHTIECWLLPIYFTNHHKSDIRNCLTTLNTELRRRNLDTVAPKKQKEKRKIVYESILRNWKKKTDIAKSASHNFGFHKFVETLGTVNAGML
jgi:hypothetical protein